MNRALLMTLLLAGCGGGDRLSIGVKAFSEQRILAEMMRILLEEETEERVDVVDCVDTHRCFVGLRSGRFDMMVEYTGTANLYYGSFTASVSMDRLRELHAPIGLSWLDPLGFDNGYRIVVPTHYATAEKLVTISDLARLKEGVRFAAPVSYTQRPGDGLSSLMLRHGIRATGSPIILEAPAERLAALFDGRADAAVVYATDGPLLDVGVTTLEDHLGFFPPYEAAIVLKNGLPPQARAALEKLSGRISTGAMQTFNYRVDVEGRSARGVGRDGLALLGLVEPAPISTKRPELIVAHDPRDHLAAFLPATMETVRRGMPGHVVRAKESKKVTELLDGGRARLAMLSAETFFADEDPRAEAVALLGVRHVHLLSKQARPKRLGHPSRGGSDARVAAMLFEAPPALEADPPQLLEALKEGRIDGAVIIARASDPAITAAISGGAKLRSIPLRTTPGFLRPARLPAATYAGQDQPIDTYAMQVLLAGPAFSRQDGPRTGGPAAALYSEGTPLSVEEANALMAVGPQQEPPDPALPSAWTRVPPPIAEDNSAVDTLLNIFVLLFLGWTALLIWRR